MSTAGTPFHRINENSSRHRPLACPLAGDQYHGKAAPPATGERADLPARHGRSALGARDSVSCGRFVSAVNRGEFGALAPVWPSIAVRFATVGASSGAWTYAQPSRTKSAFVPAAAISRSPASWRGYSRDHKSDSPAAGWRRTMRSSSPWGKTRTRASAALTSFWTRHSVRSTGAGGSAGRGPDGSHGIPGSYRVEHGR